MCLGLCGGNGDGCAASPVVVAAPPVMAFSNFDFALTAPCSWTVPLDGHQFSRPPSQLRKVTSLGKLKFSKQVRAFTEHGALMAANILNSPRAVAMSVYVIRAFVKMREDLAANAAILKRLAEIDKTLLLHDGALRDIYQKLRPLLDPQPSISKPEIGFHVKEG